MIASDNEGEQSNSDEEGKKEEKDQEDDSIEASPGVMTFDIEVASNNNYQMHSGR